MFIPSLKKVAASALPIISSKKFFYGVVVLLALQAIWMALTARYPMAFDENFHWGIIKIYSQQWGPFITSTPPDSGAYGELIRTPSYLYHYLMSFPYRLVDLVTNQETIQIIFLRFINIALFTTGLFMFRKALLKLRFSEAIANLSLLLLILIPVVPFLAGQINYDNLLFLLVPIIGMAALECGREITQKGHLPAGPVVVLLAVGMLSSLVKYAFLPVFFAAVLYVAIVIIRHKKFGSIIKKTGQAFTLLKLPLKLTLAALFIVSFGLFTERYGGNVIQYHSLDPDCAKVESVEHCKEYGPWARNYLLKTGAVPTGTDQTPFAIGWIAGMMHRLYFAINYDYINYYELPLPIITAYVFGSIGLVLVIIYWHRLFRSNPQLLFIALLTVIYVASLIYINYSDYLKYDALTAINGRYLIPILPFVFAVMLAAYKIILHRVPAGYRARVSFSLLAIALLLTSQGAGILTYAVRSDPNWYWPNPLAESLGQGLKDISSPFIIGSDSKQRG